MPGPALIVTITGDTTQLTEALGQAKTGVTGFVDSAVGLLDKTQAIKQIAGDLGELLDFAVGLGGPEAQAAFSELQTKVADGLAPAMEKLAPLIVKLIEGLIEIMDVVLPVLVPALEGLVDVLGFIFDAAGKVVEIIQDLWDKVSPLITDALNPLWTALDSLRGMFDLIWTAINAVTGLIQPLIDAVKNLLGPIGEVVGAVAGLIGDLGEALGLTNQVAEAGGGLQGGNRSGGSFAPASVTINTGADPAAVMRAYRRFVLGNGGARAAAPRGMLVRGW